MPLKAEDRVTPPAADERVELDLREGNPCLRFQAVCIAVHVLLDGLPAPDSVTLDRFTYHQREFLSYAYRDSPPIVVAPTVVPPALRTLVCRFPEIVYSSGTPKRLPATGEERRLETQTWISYFPSSDQTVFTVVLRDPDGETIDAEVPMSEFGVIRMSKLWEGGEGAGDVTATDDRLVGGRWTEFEDREGERYDFAELIDRLRAEALPAGRLVTRPDLTSGAPPRPYLTGTVQLRIEAEAVQRLALELEALQDPMVDMRDPAVADGRDPAELIALSGVLRGFASFDDTNPHELPSIFRDTSPNSRLISAVHKATFLRVAAEMRMPSIYFLLPHIIAVHNEARLDKAVELGRVQLAAGTASWDIRAARKADDHEAARRKVIETLSASVDAEAIHYPNLRTLYMSAAVSRGLEGLELRARRGADELRVEAQAIRARQQAYAQSALALIALLFTVLQVKDTIPLEIGVPLVVVFAAAWLWWTKGSD